KESRYSNPLSRILSSSSRFHSDSGYWGLSSLVSFILTENECLVEVVARELQVGFERNYGVYGWTRVCFEDHHNRPIVCHSLSILLDCRGVSEQHVPPRICQRRLPGRRSDNGDARDPTCPRFHLKSNVHAEEAWREEIRRDFFRCRSFRSEGQDVGRGDDEACLRER